MKTINLRTSFFTLLALFITQVTAFAQLDIDIDLGKAKWYEDPKVWIGVAVFLLILVLIGRSRKG